MADGLEPSRAGGRYASLSRAPSLGKARRTLSATLGKCRVLETDSVLQCGFGTAVYDVARYRDELGIAVGDQSLHPLI